LFEKEPILQLVMAHKRTKSEILQPMQLKLFDY
jgi:hypothetical protein